MQLLPTLSFTRKVKLTYNSRYLCEKLRWSVLDFCFGTKSDQVADLIKKKKKKLKLHMACESTVWISCKAVASLGLCGS